ncbi:TlpA disulfide reductase family protein [Mesonia sp. K7]|uniref:TlpA family protein disulfide reductase n=1 Tax=Mesonia sp. K7 TaxID=2218606 RepID=UPI000DA89169|nr:TlpA disulfide reductase family protein [Mesonia sp. K7]PZD77121.1 TlpA family protein disulfide reductase [Mesonia sp. K7]
MENKKKKTLFQYGIFAVVVIFFYATGVHSEVIGLAQRGLLATGLMNPDVEEIAQNTGVENKNIAKADYNLDLIDKDGNAVSLKKFKGKVIFLNFWATWCPPCLAEMPSIEKLHEEMGNEVAFVMLSFDNNFDTAKDYVKRKEFDLPLYSVASNIPDMYDSNALPTTYIIDAKGNLALTHQGMADYSDPEFKNFLNSLK